MAEREPRQTKRSTANSWLGHSSYAECGLLTVSSQETITVLLQTVKVPKSLEQILFKFHIEVAEPKAVRSQINSKRWMSIDVLYKATTAYRPTRRMYFIWYKANMESTAATVRKPKRREKEPLKNPMTYEEYAEKYVWPIYINWNSLPRTILNMLVWERSLTGCSSRKTLLLSPSPCRAPMTRAKTQKRTAKTA